MWKGVFACLLFLCPSVGWCAVTDGLREDLRRLAAGKEAEVGIAVIIDGRDTLTVNNDMRYPMMSVCKFHQALAVADACGRKGISLDSLIQIRPQDLKPDTYSPLRDRYPNGGISLPMSCLLEYTLLLSDNNACDILFDRFGGPEAVDKFVRGLGLRNFAIEVTEDEMHRDVSLCYRNWTTPLEAARLLEIFISGKAVRGDFRDFIEKTMISCRTGEDRLPAPLVGADAVIGHKTGTGDRNAEGQFIGTNDIGFVFLPDGRRYTIAVLVKDSKEDARATSRIIADVSETVYEWMCRVENVAKED